ncbi:MAG: hypothetical protein RJA99_1919 [Pseudomonadota bacterium]
MATPEFLERIRDALREDQALPALGQSVATVSRMAQGESDTVAQLARAILSDASLTRRLLRCANSPLYRIPDAAPVTTVSRALVLLGFDRVRSLALSMILIDSLVDGPRSRAVLREFSQALGAASVARCTLLRRWPACAEEAAIGALLRNVGRLIASIHVPEAVAAVRAAAGDAAFEHATAKRIIGRGYDELSLEIVAGWGLPTRIRQSLEPMPPRPSPPRQSLEWVRLASSFGDDSASLARRHGPAARHLTVSALQHRYGEALAMDADAIADLLAQAHRETLLLAKALGLGSVVAETLGAAPAVAGGSGPVAGIGADGAAATIGAPSVPADGGLTAGAAKAATGAAHRRLLSSLTLLSDALAEARGLGRVVQIATDALHDALGADRVVYFVRDDAAAVYRPRAAAGIAISLLRGRIAMPLQFAPDLFHAALARGADLHLADTSADTVRTRLPQWHAHAFPSARGVLLLPVRVEDRPMGFFYVDRDAAGAPPPDAERAEAIRLLRDQVVLALRAEPTTR